MNHEATAAYLLMGTQLVGISHEIGICGEGTLGASTSDRMRLWNALPVNIQCEVQRHRAQRDSMSREERIQDAERIISLCST